MTTEAKPKRKRNMLFRLRYWESHKIVSEVVEGADCEITDGMLYLLDKDGKTTFCTRRVSVISVVRVEALKEQSGGVGHGKGKAPTIGGSNVRSIKQSDGQD
jgi:hypothetical protein